MNHPSWGRLKKRIRASLSLAFLHEIPVEKRPGLFAFGTENIFTQLSENVLYQFVPLYAIQLGVSNTQIGAIPALGNLFAALAQLPGAMLVERLGHRKRIALATSLLARLFIFGILTTTFLACSTLWLVRIVTAFFALKAFFIALGQPAWTSLAADVVPMHVRGRFFALRDFLLRIALLVTLPLAGWIADALPIPRGYQVVFFVAWVLGVLAIWALTRVPDPAPLPAEYVKTRPRRPLRQAIQDERDFVMFVLANIIWNLSLTIAGPYFNVHLVRNLGGNAKWVGLLSAVASISGLVGTMFWGQRIDRWGNLRVNRITALVIPLFPWMWILVTAPWQVIFINALVGLMWSGFLISNFNLLLSLSPPRQRARFAALYQTGVLLSAFVGPFIGGPVADHYGFHMVFLLSGIGRYMGAFILLLLVRRGEYNPLSPQNTTQAR